jgi:trk system potassium uptake protein TrkH
MWMGIFHSISAFCNAGFSITGGFKSLTGYVNDLTVNITMMILIVCGGIGFYVLVEIFNALRARFKNEERRKFSLHTRIVLKATFTLIIIGTVLIMLFEWNNPETLGALNLRGKILSSFFQAITPRTAGFNTIDIASLHQTTLLEMICLMFIGGSPGGTAGGVKTTTFTIILALLIHAYRERIPITITGRTIKLKTIRRALFIAGFAILVILISTMVILWNQGDEFTLSQVLFEVVSAFGTVGLSTGITANLSILSRIVIIATMFIGRVGPLSFILSITTRSKVAVPAYPEEEVAVG